jgi:NADPH:quinone reductase-like Zn-dependent oxidoreductase
MRAAYLRATGGPDVIEVGSLPVPALGPADVLVRFAASEVNHVDAFVRSGAYPTPLPLPFVIGRDLVGVAAGRGAGVRRFEIGDRVWCNSLGHGGRQGSFAEYSAVDVDRLYPLPDGVDPVDAAAVLHGAGTAWLGLVREARVRPGEIVLIGGGAGAVGGAALQLGAAMGARVLATCSARDAAWCRNHGADVVIDYRADDLAERVRRAAPNGIDVWWDTSGHNDLAGWVTLLRQGGRVVMSAGLGATAALPVGALYTNGASVRGFVISNASAGDLADAAVTINHLLSTGRLAGRIGAMFQLGQAAQAHAAMESGEVRGRIVVLP